MAVDTLSERFNTKYESLLERMSKLEAKVEMISINNPGKSK